MTVPVKKGKGERTKCRNYRVISLVGKIYAGILVDWGLIDDEQGSFRAGRGCVD